MALDDLAHEGSGATSDFLRWQFEQFWSATETGACTWWQATDPDGAPRAQCGIALAESVGRYREVLTHPACRQQGWGRALIAGSAAHVLDSGLCTRLAIIASAGSVAERLYRSVGFVPVSMQLAVRLAI